MTFEEFVGFYEGHWGKMPIDTAIKADRAPWETLVRALGDHDLDRFMEVVATFHRTGEGKLKSVVPKLGVMWEAYRAMKASSTAVKYVDVDEFARDLRISEEPLFDCSANTPTRRRIVFKVDLPKESKRELNRLTKAVVRGQMTPEEAKRMADTWWSADRPRWADYTAEEQGGLRLEWERWEPTQAVFEEQ